MYKERVVTLVISFSIPFSSILIPVDRSENASRALEYALRLAKSTASKATLLSVVEDNNIPYPVESYVSIRELERSFEESAKKYVDDLLSKAERNYGIEARAIVRRGHPAKVILDVAKSEGADLIIMGSRGMGSFKEMLLGSVSHAVVSHATVPVLIVR